MEAVEAIYKQVEAYFQADTTTLVGLNAQDSPAYVRDFARVGDPETRAAPSWPNIEVDVNAVERPVPTGTTSYELFDSVVTFVIEVDRDAGFTALNRVTSRLRDRFHNASLSNLVDTDAAGRTWSFAPMSRLDPRRLPNTSPKNKTYRMACPFRVIATKGAT